MIKDTPGDIDTNVPPVLVNGHVYVKGIPFATEQERVWRYSISDNEWFSLPTPKEKMLKYALANYHSQLVCIGGYIIVDNKYQTNKQIFALDEQTGCWKNHDSIPDLDREDIPFHDVSAASDAEGIALSWPGKRMVGSTFCTSMAMCGSQR